MPLDSYSEADAIYTWKRGHEHSIEQAPDISLPQMDLVKIQSSETTDVYSTGRTNNKDLEQNKQTKNLRISCIIILFGKKKYTFLEINCERNPTLPSDKQSPLGVIALHFGLLKQIKWTNFYLYPEILL